MSEEIKKPWQVTSNRMSEILEQTDFSYLDKEMEEFADNCKNRKGLAFKDMDLNIKETAKNKINNNKII